MTDSERLAILEARLDKLEQLTTGRMAYYDHYGSLKERLLRLERRVLTQAELKDEAERLERVRLYRESKS